MQQLPIILRALTSLRRLLLIMLRIAAIPGVASAAEPVILTAAFDRPTGVIRPLHGINKGPLA